MSVQFIEPKLEDAEQLAWKLRTEDLVETVLLTGSLPQGVLPGGLLSSTRAYTIISPDGGLCGMCGVTPSREPELGQAWFLATDLVEEHSLSLLKKSPKYLDRLAEKYPRGLYALLWEGNPQHLRWATAVGFKIAGHQYIRQNLFLTIQRP